ncbi:MAG TPA: S8 family serine peptidase [Pyrinomonadaceae bacterium]|nr:S8 family serine peptidase [Pyrinomonadaceae bacterium]
MNRQNFIIHLAIAVVLVIMAAAAGQMRHWQKEGSLTVDHAVKRSTPKPTAAVRGAADREPEVLVKFRREVSFDDIKKIAAKNNDNVEDEIESVDKLVAIDDMDGQSAEAVAEQYSKMSNLVLYAEPNLEIEASPLEDLKTVTPKDNVNPADQPNDPMFSDQWALNNTGQNGGKRKADIDVLKAWQKTKGSRKVVVAVLDSGVDYTHPDLAANMWTRPDNIPVYKDDELGTIPDLHGFSAVDDRDPMDDNGHGTHCAGVIGAEGNNDEGIAGINWEVEIMPLKFLGRGGFGTTKDAIEAINYAIERKRAGVNIRVINASWGSTTYSKALEDVIRAAGDEGILFVAAAGNDGSSNDSRPHYPSSYNLPNVISVAALDRVDLMATFSNFGVKSVHVAAPGKDIVSTWLNGEYREASGTSMATPQVAGIAALVLAQDPKMSVQKLRQKLLSSVDLLDTLTGKLENAGRINASKVLGN